MPSGLAAAFVPPRSTTRPRLRCLYARRSPWPSEAATLWPATTPWRCACCAVIPVAARVGELDLPGDVVAQVQRLGDAPEPARVLGDPRDGQQLVHTACRDHQAVVSHL